MTGISKWDFIGANERKVWQGRAFGRFVRDQVAPYSPFYRKLFAQQRIDPTQLRSLDDLRRIPFTTKEDLLPTAERPDAARDFILTPTEETLRAHLPLSRKLQFLGQSALGRKDRVRASLQSEYNPETLLVTTGRSAGSVPVFLTPHDRRRLVEAGRRICGHLDLKSGRDRTLSLFPYAPHLAFWQVSACGEGANVLTFNSGGGRIIPTTRLLETIATFRPTCIAGMPGFVGHLLRQAVAENRDWSSVKVVTLGGENVPQGLADKLSQLLMRVRAPKARVVSVLGFTEARSCWTECHHGRFGFHTNPDMEVLEIVDPATGDPLPEGATGELVYSCLNGRGSVLLRYRTGDIIEGGVSESEPCRGCGSLVPRIRSDLARVSNVRELNLSKVKGTLVNLNDLSSIITGDAGVEEWQLEICKRNDDALDVDELVLNVSQRGTEPLSNLEARLQSAIFARSELHVNHIRSMPLAEVVARLGTETQTKEDRIVDRRHHAR